MEQKHTGIVRLDTYPRGAQIIVDGQILTDQYTEEAVRTPASVVLYEGRHDVTLRLHGYDDIMGYVDIWPGTTVDIFRSFEDHQRDRQGDRQRDRQGDHQRDRQGDRRGREYSEQALLTPNTGMIRVYSDPDGANVYIDGNPVRDSSGQLAKTPVIITDVPAGVRYVTFRMPGMMEEMETVDVGPGSYSNAYATMRPTIPEWP